MKYIIPIVPVAKPRMTRRDKWLDPPRPIVGRYFAFASELGYRMKEQGWDGTGSQIGIVAYMQMPPKWSGRERRDASGTPHTNTPDIDNIIKAVCDSLWAEDKAVWSVSARKYWDDGNGPRLELDIE